MAIRNSEIQDSSVAHVEPFTGWPGYSQACRAVANVNEFAASVAQRCFRAGNRVSVPDLGRILVQVQPLVVVSVRDGRRSLGVSVLFCGFFFFVTSIAPNPINS